MNFNKLYFYIFAFFAPLFIACDVINSDNRAIKMEKVVPLKKVLLLDFTDQNCPICPKASVAVQQLKMEYDTAFIPVTIHAANRNYPLVTTAGNAYDSHFGTNGTGHPAAVIDGRFDKSFANNFDLWGGIVLQQFTKWPAVNIGLDLNYDTNTNEIRIEAALSVLSELANPKLLVWIVQDEVIDRQLVDNAIVSDYHHHHIFRASVNGTWGETIDLNSDTEKSYTFILDKNWINKEGKPDVFSIVAFVYNADTDAVYGVDAVKLEIKN